MTQELKRVVVIGGGTGTSTVVAGLKNMPIHITALISMADSGGSTGRLRDEFGFQPVGDLRQSLAALAEEESQEWIRKLLLYRFEKGEGLRGHNLGNLILTALQDMAGSTTSALEIAERVFQLRGEIYPVTTQDVQLVVEYSDGTVRVGEHYLDDNTIGNRKIKRVRLSPKAEIYSKAKEALRHADMVVIGPGDYYASIMAALSVNGIKKAFEKVPGKIVYIVNLMTRFTQTQGMSARDHLAGIEKAIGRKCDVVLINNAPFPPKVTKAYKEQQEFPVENDLPENSYVARNLFSATPFYQSNSDTAHRSLLRHDSKKLADLLMEFL